jgi:predicted RNA binding protein YcfA (HicA-like mRNA interferase family)
MRRGSQGCAVPMHRELKIGTLTGILRQADIDPEEFVQALKG